LSVGHAVAGGRVVVAFLVVVVVVVVVVTVVVTGQHLESLRPLGLQVRAAPDLNVFISL